MVRKHIYNSNVDFTSHVVTDVALVVRIVRYGLGGGCCRQTTIT
jgi:hypothetical protein